MPVSSPSPAVHLLAHRHTDLLRRMLIARHFTESHVPVPIPGHADLELAIDHGEEAMLVGLSGALAPTDTLIRSCLPVGHAPTCAAGGPGSLMVCVYDHTHDDRGRLFVLSSATPPPTAAPARLECLPTEPVDGLNVEAVLTNAYHTAQAARCCNGPLLMEMDMSGHIDSIDILTGRMRAARELDDNALHAIDDNAARLVQAVLTARDATTQL